MVEKWPWQRLVLQTGPILWCDIIHYHDIITMLWQMTIIFIQTAMRYGFNFIMQSVVKVNWTTTINKMFQLVWFNICIFNYVLMGFQRQFIYNCIFKIQFLIDMTLPKCLNPIILMNKFQQNFFFCQYFFPIFIQFQLLGVCLWCKTRILKKAS